MSFHHLLTVPKLKFLDFDTVVSVGHGVLHKLDGEFFDLLYAKSTPVTPHRVPLTISWY